MTIALSHVFATQLDRATL